MRVLMRMQSHGPNRRIKNDDDSRHLLLAKLMNSIGNLHVFDSVIR
uniref:Transposase n=1 Tax=Ascaris lumbricoides TaxID=6252 RepID=A0A0M3IQZ9_ASCLU